MEAKKVVKKKNKSSKISYKYKIWQDEFEESPNDWGDENIFLIANHREFSVKREYFDEDEICTYLSLKNKFEDKTHESIVEICKKNCIDYLISESEPINNDYIESEWESHRVNEELLEEWEEYNIYNGEHKYGNYYIYSLIAYIHSGVSLSLTDGYPFNCQWDSGQVGYVLVSKKEDFGTRTPYEVAKGLVETWNQYLQNDVWGYSIVKLTKCNCCKKITRETLDSCGGYYGRDYTVLEAKGTLKLYKEKEPTLLKTI